MAIPSTRDGFRDYCKRAIGFGVIDINVSDAQVEDRIDEGLQYFAQYHYDGVERMYIKYKITEDDITRGRSNESTTATELNLLDGDTSVGSSVTLADNDGIIVNDGGTMKSIPASDVLTYTADEATALAIALG